MNYLDIVTLVIILWGFWTGVQKGLIRSLTSLIGWLLALVLGSRFATLLAPQLSMLSDDLVVQKIAAFAVIVLLVLTVTALIGQLLRSLLKAMALGIPERLAGGVFGAAKGTLVIMLGIQLLGPWVAESPHWHKSKIIALLSPFAPTVVDFSREVATQAWDEVNEHATPHTEHSPHEDATPTPSASDEPAQQDNVPNPFS